jgi:predicted metal-dependent enzyme (double-stranded beta helix superfamily)
MIFGTEEGERIAGFIADLDRAVGADADRGRITEAVKNVLKEDVRVREALPARFLVPSARCYARRLLHKDPADRFSIVVMVWDRGQATPIHDHCGMWCVECVVLGRIQVTQYDMVPFTHGPLVEFREAGCLTAGIGEAGALIPPFDYHKIENLSGTKAATIHVYGGEMTSCTAFYPEGGRYRHAYCDLSYTTD